LGSSLWLSTAMMRECPLAGVNPDIARILRKDRL